MLYVTNATIAYNSHAAGIILGKRIWQTGVCEYPVHIRSYRQAVLALNHPA